MDSPVPDQFDTPILFLIFNRPDLTARVFERIRELRPKYLFVAADGPRKDKPEDIEKCEAARTAVLSRLDWPCELNTLFRDNNLGCGISVSEAITWFFEHVEMGIILEDDCLPDISFFNYCSELLQKYHYEARIMHIGGSSFLDNKIKIKFSYYFSNYPNIWGWATWRRAWKFYELNPICTKAEIWKHLSLSRMNYTQKKYWSKIFFDSFIEKIIDTWDFSWHYVILRNKGLSVLPRNTLVKNIGFGGDSTHTKHIDFDYSINPVISIQHIIHPSDIFINRKADNYNFKKVFLRPTSIKNHLRNLGYSIIPKGTYQFIKNLYYRSIKIQ